MSSIEEEQLGSLLNGLDLQLDLQTVEIRSWGGTPNPRPEGCEGIGTQKLLVGLEPKLGVLRPWAWGPKT